MLIVSSSRDDREVGRRVQPAAGVQRLDVGGRDVGDVGPALVDRVHLARVEVDAGRVESRFCEFHRERQADISEADHAGSGAGGVRSSKQQSGGECGHPKDLLQKLSARSIDARSPQGAGDLERSACPKARSGPHENLRHRSLLVCFRSNIPILQRQKTSVTRTIVRFLMSAFARFPKYAAISDLVWRSPSRSRAFLEGVRMRPAARGHEPTIAEATTVLRP